MVNITDGLPWPLKAAPQTLLYILQLFEVRIARVYNELTWLDDTAAGLPRRPSEDYILAVLRSTDVEDLGKGHKEGEVGVR